MTTQSETWQKACVIAGVWTPGQRCDGCHGMILFLSNIAHYPHNILCPPVGDPAATVKMLEWLWERGTITIGPEGVEFTDEETEQVSPLFGGPLHDALAAAIVALGEKE